MAVKHTILLCNSYSSKKRICLHYAGVSESEISRGNSLVHEAYGGKTVPYSVHVISTDSPDWNSVVSKDPYFQDVVPIESIDEFLSLIQKDRYLSGLDVARYILSKESCTHTRLQKLSYMCYADYLCTTGDRLFNDAIYAFDYGPVIESVYKRYSPSSHNMPGTNLDDSIEIGGPPYMPIRSRILCSEDGYAKADSIDRTLKKYGRLSTKDLVDITHRSGTPWDRAKDTNWGIIYDQVIQAYHALEDP